MKITPYEPPLKIQISHEQLHSELQSPVVEAHEIAPDVWVCTMFLGADVAGSDCMIRGSGARLHDAIHHMYVAAAHHVFPQYNVLQPKKEEALNV